MIDEARAAGIRWVVVAAHIPCLSVGGYTCPTPRDFVDLMMAKKVDLVLSGHEHAYMRTHQLRSGVTGCSRLTVGSTNTACIADRDSSYTAGAGTVWATVGTGGVPLRNVSGSDSEAGYFASYAGANRSPSYGVLDLRISSGQLTAAFLPAIGTHRDQFSLTRTGSAPPSGPVVPPPTGTRFAADSFARTVSSGFGTAEAGGAWGTTGSTSVGSGAGRMRLGAPGTGASAVLPGATSASTDLALRLSADRAATGGGISAGVLARRVSGSRDYRAGVRMASGGGVEVTLRRVVDGREVVLARTTVPGLTTAAGAWLRVRVQAVGANPTALRVKAWRDGSPEPSAWALQTADATAGLQTSGGVGVTGYLSSSASTAPVVLSIDDLVAVRP